MTFQDKIQEYFEDLLKDNPLGIQFVLGQFIHQSDVRFELDFIPNTVVKYKSTYVPAMLSSADTPKGIPNVDAYEWVFSIDFALSGEDTKTEPQVSQRKAIDWFRKTLVDTQIKTLDVDGITYKLVHTAFNLTSGQAVLVDNGDKRTLVTMQIAVQSGIGVFFGNEIKTFLKLDSESESSFVELKTFNSGYGLNKAMSSGFALTGTKTNNVAIDSAYRYTTTILYEDIPILNEIAKEALGSGNTLNKAYTLRTTFTPLGTISDRKVVLQGITVNDNNGQYVTLSFDVVDTI